MSNWGPHLLIKHLSLADTLLDGTQALALVLQLKTRRADALL